MATTTTNYNLTKPSGTDRVDVSVINANMDTIDTQMKAQETELDEKLPISGGTITGNLTVDGTTTLGGNTYMSGSGTPLLIGSNGKIGLRASGGSTIGNAGQINISDSWYGGDKTQWGAQISAYDSVANKYNQFRVSHDGLQYLVYDNSTGTETAQEVALVEDIPDVSNFETKANAITGLSASGTTVTYTKGDGSTGMITTQDTKVTVDDALSSTSTNPVQNKAVYSALSEKADSSALSSYLPLAGGTMTGELKVNGGDKTGGSKITLVTNAGQITDSSTSTLFGFVSSGNIACGHGSYNMQIRGKASRPTYNNSNIALQSDIPDVSGKQDTLTAGTGLAFADDGVTLNHSNSVTAQTTYVGSATAVPRLKFDAQGHITGVSTATIYPPTSAGSNGQVWVADGSGAGAWKTLVTISTSDPSGGSDGDLWFKYE